MWRVLFFAVSILGMVVGHLFKVKRWGLFISVYEKPSFANLLNALSIGHSANAILPFRIGEVIRVIWSGKKLKNGYALSLATVCADLYVDVLAVGAMFLGLAWLGKGGDKLHAVSMIYAMVMCVVVILTVVAVLCRKTIKSLVRVVAGIFNEEIESGLLYIVYLCIASLKDILKNIHKFRFVIYTLLMWTAYVVSYVFFAETIQLFGFPYSTSDIFTVLFSGAGLYNIEISLVPFWASYIILPLLFCWVISVFMQKKDVEQVEYMLALPQLNRTDRSSFLKVYYEEENREYVQAYLGINRDVTVIDDRSAGSNASTILVMKPNGKLFFRKYAFMQDGEKLQEQIEWIEQHQKDIALPPIVEKKNAFNCVSYDMPNYAGATDLFRYIHLVPPEQSWDIVRKALEDIDVGLHRKNVRQADKQIVSEYIDTKVIRNLNIIRDSKYIRQLEQNDFVVVNGIQLPTLKTYKDMLSKEHLESIFAVDTYADIHGDLTIENIICRGDDERGYYFIDPNTGNIHESPFLDYAKLLQSLHGNYEFLMMVTSVEIENSSVNYLLTKSGAYSTIYNNYKEYLLNKFSKEEVISIYYHEIVHWLRLMPYKISKNEKTAVVFYTGLLAVLNEVRGIEEILNKSVGDLSEKDFPKRNS